MGASAATVREQRPRDNASRRRSGRWTRWLAASALLIALNAGSWPSTVDDVYISLAYAHEWAGRGALQWTTGERVEGYSNFLHVALLALGVLARVDGAQLAQGIALVGGLGVLALFGARLPPGPAGSVVLLALAGWSALGWWATVGMETTSFALLFAAGWSMAIGHQRTFGLGVALLAIGALERPEGTVWLLAGLAARLRHPRALGEADAVAAVSVLGLAAWHAARVAWFGEGVPTPLLVKIATVHGSWGGLAQAAGDVLVAGGWIVGVVALARVRARDLPWVLAPVVGQVIVLTRAEGDWMGMSRILLPGIVASAAAWLTVGAPRAVGRAGVLALVLAGLVGAALVPGGEKRFLPELRPSPSSRPLHELMRGLDTPVDLDVAFVIAHVPPGERILVVDVGMLGNVHGVRVLDQHGLTWRACARALAEGRHLAFLEDVLAAEDAPEFVRFAWWGGTPPREEEVERRLPAEWRLRAELVYPPTSFVRWYARHDRRPDAAAVEDRWGALAARYPSQPFLARSLARVLAGEDVRGGAVRAPEGHAVGVATVDVFAATEGHPVEPGRGVALYWNSTVKSVPLTRVEALAGRLRLDADAPGIEGAQARVTWTADCGERAEIVTVDGPIELTVALPCEGDGPFRAFVTFVNDATGTAGDRNLYVSWTAARGR